MLYSVLGYVGLVLVFFGAGILTRWSLTQTQNPKARVAGIVRGSCVEFLGLAFVFLDMQNEPGRLMPILLLSSIVLGACFGLVAAKALQVPR